jgi:hypothetical protein
MSGPTLDVREYFALCLAQALAASQPEADVHGLSARALGLADALLALLYPPEPLDPPA